MPNRITGFQANEVEGREVLDGPAALSGQGSQPGVGVHDPRVFQAFQEGQVGNAVRVEGAAFEVAPPTAAPVSRPRKKRDTSPFSSTCLASFWFFAISQFHSKSTGVTRTMKRRQDVIHLIRLMSNINSPIFRNGACDNRSVYLFLVMV